MASPMDSSLLILMSLLSCPLLFLCMLQNYPLLPSCTELTCCLLQFHYFTSASTHGHPGCPHSTKAVSELSSGPEAVVLYITSGLWNNLEEGGGILKFPERYVHADTPIPLFSPHMTTYSHVVEQYGNGCINCRSM
jgi:hypothetical protein